MGFITPYVINGAAHSAALFRRQAQRPASDQAGVSRPGDLRVSPLNVPADGFRMAVGGASIPSRYPGRERESYGVENADTEITVTGVVGTGSQATRRDAIIVEVLDPNYTAITHEEAAPLNYTQVRVVQNVPANAKTVADIPALAGVTAYVVSFIDWPKSTGTITAEMLKDPRQVANPQRGERVYARPRIAADDGVQNFLVATVANGGEYFPGGGGYANEFQVDIPEWATRMVIDARWMSVYYKQNPYGYFWVEYGDEYRPHTWPNKRQYEFATQSFAFNAPNTGADEKTDQWSLMDEVAVPAKLRGKRVTFVFKAGVATAAMGTGKWVWMNSLGGLGMRVTFAEVAEGPNLI